MKSKIIAIITLVACLFTMTAFAVFADGENEIPDGETGSVPEVADIANETEPESDIVTSVGDNVVDDPFDIESETETETAAVEEKTDPAIILWNLIIGGVVVAGIIAAVVVFFFTPKHREKTLKFFRSLKSEWKKISWYSWKQTWKGTLVVAIVSIVIAIVIGLLDTGFSMGLNSLSDLF